MEDVNNEIHGGLYDQKIAGESFEKPASGVNYCESKSILLLVWSKGVSQ